MCSSDLLSGAFRRKRDPPRRAHVPDVGGVSPPQGSPQSHRLCGERRSSGMSEPCRMRRGEGYGACDDEVVNKCALNREKRRRSAPVVRNTPRLSPLNLEQAEKKAPYLVQFHKSCGMVVKKPGMTANPYESEISHSIQCSMRENVIAKAAPVGI